jgi:hypothetical protein
MLAVPPPHSTASAQHRPVSNVAALTRSRALAAARERSTALDSQQR